METLRRKVIMTKPLYLTIRNKLSLEYDLFQLGVKGWRRKIIHKNGHGHKGDHGS
jgi:hypothetical protein